VASRPLQYMLTAVMNDEQGHPSPSTSARGTCRTFKATWVRIRVLRYVVMGCFLKSTGLRVEGFGRRARREGPLTGWPVGTFRGPTALSAARR
jgi:hypothetical protein